MTNPSGQTDPRVRALRAGLIANADPLHAEFHRNYHKSELQFHGLRAPVLKQLYREVFSARSKPGYEELNDIVRPLWQSGCWEETMLAIMLLEKHCQHLPLSYVASIYKMTGECEGWAQLDGLACGVLSRMALRLDDDDEQRKQFYDTVAGWIDDDYMWTRRASILVHMHPSRQGELAQEYCWKTWEARLHETEFFIRKAIGWALREASRQYPREVHAFLRRVGDRASGLTRREGARKLPEKLCVDLLGK